MLIKRFSPQQQPMNLIYTTSWGAQLWLGDYYAATNLPLLHQRKIQSVLTSAAMLGIVYPKDAKINHKVINAKDVPSYKMTPHFEDVFQFMNGSLKKGNLLVHCAAGVSRSATFVIAYLMRTEHMTFKETFNMVKSKRSIVCPNTGFQSELKKFEIVEGRKILPAIDKPAIQEKKQNLRILSQKETVYQNKKQDRFKNRSQCRPSYSLGGKSLSNKIFLSMANQPKKIQRESLLQVALMRNQAFSAGITPRPTKEQDRSSKQNKEIQNLKSQMSKLTRQYLVIRQENPKGLTIQR